MANPHDIAVAVSGGGRSLANLLALEATYSYRVAGVIASRPDCGAVQIAKQAKRSLLIEDFPKNGLPEEKQEALQTWLQGTGASLIVLAGFLRPFPVLPEWQGRIINIHPALLPRHGGHGMYGNKVHAAVLAAGDDISGATVHLVTAEYDRGKILAQARVAVHQDDKVEALAARVFAAECQLLPLVCHEWVNGTLGKKAAPLILDLRHET